MIGEKKSEDNENFLDSQWVKNNADLEKLRNEYLQVQTWLDFNYPKGERNEIKELDISNKNLEGELDLKDFSSIQKLNFSNNQLTDLDISSNSQLKELDISGNAILEKNIDGLLKDSFILYDNKYIIKQDAQEWLDENYPQNDICQDESNEKNEGKKREEVEELNINRKSLKGHLDLTDFVNLKGLHCAENELAEITISPLAKEKIKVLFLERNNHLGEGLHLSYFSEFINLETLRITATSFSGSLEFLKDLTKLKELSIGSTNIDFGLEFLPESVENLDTDSESYPNPLNPNPQIIKIREQLAPCDNDIKIWRERWKKWREKLFTSKEINQWMEAGLRIDELDFAIYLKKEKDYTPHNFNDEENKTQIWLNWKYPQENRKEITELIISNERLKGSLELKGFENLKGLNCSNNKLTNLDLSDCSELTKLECHLNELTDTSFLTNLPDPKNLTYLNIESNNFSEQDLAFLNKLVNLEELHLGTTEEGRVKENKYNRFVGSLEPLGDLRKLKILDISNIDIENGLDFLPENVKEIYCSDKEGSESGVSKSLKKTLDFAFVDNKYKRLTNAQKWLDENFPKEGTSKYSGCEGKKRSEITRLDINNNFLKGSLELEGFDGLEELNCYDNYLTDIDFADIKNPEKLKKLYLYNNNFSKSELTLFNRFKNLEELVITSNYLNQNYKEGIANRFMGSLNLLKDLTKLRRLDIENTDISEGLEHLPDSVENFYCEAGDDWKREEAEVKEISKQLSDYGTEGQYDLLSWKRNKKWKDKLGNKFEEWVKVGSLEQKEVDFAAYLEEKKCDPSDADKIGELKKEYHRAQTWLEHNYPVRERKDIKILKIASKGLKEELSLMGFTNLEELDCSNNELTGLNLSDNKKLKRLNCGSNIITKLDLTYLKHLESLFCNDNLIKDLDLSHLDADKLTYLDIKDNNLNSDGLRDLSDFNRFVNLKTLSIGNDKEEKCNHFSGSLSPLAKLKNLEELHISNTDISEVVIEELPESLNHITSSTKERTNSKLEKIKEKLNSYNTKKLLNRMYPDKRATALTNLYSESLKGHLDLSEYVNLEELDCFSNELTSLDISRCSQLKRLNCSNNSFTNLNLSKNVQLIELDCSNNKLVKIDLKDNKNLTKLNCSNNHQLTELSGVENCNKLFTIFHDDSLKDYKNFLSRLTETNKKKGEWKKIDAQNWLNEEYPESGWTENFGQENKSRKRKDIRELDISGEGLEGILKLKGFDDLRYLTCRNNQLIEIDLADCPKLEGIDCSFNKLKKLKFNKDCNLKELQASDNEFESIKDIFSKIEEKVKNKYSTETLEYFNVNNNNISDGKIENFNKFAKLKSLSIGKTDGTTKTNKFAGSLESLKDLEVLLEIDIRGNNDVNIKEYVKNFLREGMKLESSETSSPKEWKSLEKIYIEHITKNEEETIRKLNKKKELDDKEKIDLNKAKQEILRLEELKKFYNEGNFYDIKSLLKSEKSSSRDTSVKSIVKLPILSEEKGKYKANTKTKSGGSSQEDYFVKGKVIYPSEEAGFGWGTIGELPPSKLPRRLCEIGSEIKGKEANGQIEELKKDLEGLKDFTTQLSKLSKEEKEQLKKQIETLEEDVEIISQEQLDKKVKEIKNDINYLENASGFERQELKKKVNEIRDKLKETLLTVKVDKTIQVKTRVECESAKHYAILSYTWDGSAKEDIKWSPENAQKRLSLGGVKSLDKALKALKVLNEFHLFKNEKSEIKYLWMDQMCIDQDNIKEREHEVPMMRQYYGNSTVTLVAIHTSIGEDTMKKLLNSFVKDKNGLIYPNEVVKNSLLILQKIIDSNWFQRSWTFQEGFLSKQTIFMFDDFLIDGRFIALVWKLRQFSEAHYEECDSMAKLCGEKIATPVGWAYYKDNYSIGDEASLRLNEGLWAVKERGRSIALDGIYSIIGLLPYGKEVKVNYEKDPESVLREVMFTATEHGYGEPLAWHGSGSKKPGLCWVPEVGGAGGSKGSSNVKGSIEVEYKPKKEKLLDFIQDKGIRITGSEYVISWKDGGIYKLEREETVDGGLWRRKIQVKIENSKEPINLTLSGTKEGVEAANEGRILIIPNKGEWEWKDGGGKEFALLAIKVRNHNIESQVKQLEKEIDDLENKTDKKVKGLKRIVKKMKEKDNIFHRLDLVRIEEGYDKLEKLDDKEFIIGLNNQEDTKQYQAQIEVNPYQK